MHLTAGVLIGLLLCAWIGQGIQSHSKRALAWREYYALKDQVRAYREATGEYPDTLQRLGWRLSEVFPNSQPTDPWGRPWQYRYPVKDWRDQPSFALSSPGPDGKPDTSDDITAK
ncbi:MAG: type II secretion system protein GspG [Candidatus Sumerlaeota bacterium]|nr:type II secretion system protein GspG [Candidatus Sumerlaeota bacterium]